MYLTPVTEEFQQPSHLWLASAHGTDATKSIALRVSTFTAGTHYPNGYIPDGTPLGLIDGTDNTFGLYAEAATDGRDTLGGFLYMPIRVPTGATVVGGALLDHGAIYAARLPFAINQDATFDLNGRIIVRDLPYLERAGS